MIKLEIYDNLKPALSFYGGNAGTKKAFYKSDGTKWFLKFPKITKNFENVDISYTTGVLSEYIGSQIYKSMGIPVHETELGIYNDTLVTACKDFKLNNSFYEMKNVFNENLGKYEKSREDLIGNTESSYYIELKELIYVFEHNENLKNIKEIKERFWDMFIVDCFINNNDRHNGNWGIFVLESENKISLAPVYDNGNSLFPKHSEEKMMKTLENLKQILMNGRTPYIYKEKMVDSVKVIRNLSLRGNNLNFGDTEEDKFLKEVSDSLQKAILRNIPKIDMEKINKIIDEIPEEYNGIKIMSSLMKNFYKTFLNERYKQVLLPALEKVVKIEKNKNLKRNNWEIAIGLNKVDRLNPSLYLRELAAQHIDGKISFKEIEENLFKYYENKDLKNKEERNTRECDIVSVRIVELLEDDSFIFNPAYLKTIHKHLFQGVFKNSIKDYAGVFRDYNISKEEDILNGKSIVYGDYQNLMEYLKYDFDEEEKNDYNKLSFEEQIEKISRFTSAIWQVHPFVEGNTRTTAIFMIKYLKNKGYNLNESIFIENSLYFRNALVISNFTDMCLKISPNFKELESFFSKLIKI